MLKKIIILLFLTVNVFAQEYKINVEQIKTDSQILHGSIDGKYDITIYLKLASYSEDHSGIYSVSGWYHYDKFKKNIPIAGLYDFTDGLTLYALKDTSLQEKIISFDIPGGNVWDKIEYIKAISNFEEKFTISDGDKNKWSSKSNELKLTVYNFQNNPIVKEFVLLRLNKSTVVNLSDLSIVYDELQIINTIKTKSETKILLEYQTGGNSNIQGMCGGATDSGYIILSFDSNNKLNYKEILEVENCRSFVYSEKIASNEKSKLKFKITNSNGGKEQVTKIIVDTNSISFSKEK